jgi:heme O synthase-like polyprenyltransferase
MMMLASIITVLILLAWYPQHVIKFQAKYFKHYPNISIFLINKYQKCIKINKQTFTHSLENISSIFLIYIIINKYKHGVEKFVFITPGIIY